MAVDLGVPGLLLWLVGIAAVLRYGFISVQRLPRGSLELHLAIGCLAAVVAQCVDCIGNPSWQFPDVPFYLWTEMGLLVAAGNVGARSAGSRHEEQTAEPAAEPLVVRLLKLAVIIPMVLWLAHKAVSTARLLPMPRL